MTPAHVEAPTAPRRGLVLCRYVHDSARLTAWWCPCPTRRVVQLWTRFQRGRIWLSGTGRARNSMLSHVAWESRPRETSRTSHNACSSTWANQPQRQQSVASDPSRWMGVVLSCRVAFDRAHRSQRGRTVTPASRSSRSLPVPRLGRSRRRRSRNVRTPAVK